MRMYTLNPASISYEDGKEYTESEIIWWAEDVAERLKQEWTDLTLLFDRDPYDSIDLDRAIDILEQVNEFVEPVFP